MALPHPPTARLRLQALPRQPLRPLRPRTDPDAPAIKKGEPRGSPFLFCGYRFGRRYFRFISLRTCTAISGLLVINPSTPIFQSRTMSAGASIV